MIFNAVLFLLDAFTLAVLARYRKIWVGLLLGALVAAEGFFLGTKLATSLFDLARLAAYGIFLHAPLLLLGAGVLWWKPRKLVAVGLIAAAGLLVAVAGYAFLIEPNWLDVSHYEIASPKIHRPMRIVVIADFQTERFGDYEKRVLREALAQRPDLILLAGDYLQVPQEKRPEQLQAVNAFLREINFSAPLGIFAVQGNVDGYDWHDMFAGPEVNCVEERRHFALDDLQITCLGLGESYFTHTRAENPDPEKFHIVMGHVPNFALGKIDGDLLVAGHTHGGQVRFPILGALTVNAKIPKSWAAGLTNLPRGGALLVPRGIGMERGDAPQMRFLCRPELAVIDLKPEKGS